MPTSISIPLRNAVIARAQQRNEHFRFEGAHIAPLTPEGRAAVFLLQLNTPERVQERIALDVKE